MKREGWQHGMLRTSPRPNCKLVNSSDSPPAAGKLHRRPTNHSKHTAKCPKARCSVCHCHPVSKSRAKAKGEYKLKSCDVGLNHRLVTWRAVDTVRGLRCTSFTSASGVLQYLSGSYNEEGDDLYEEEEDYMKYDHGDDQLESSMAMEEDEEMEFYEVGFVVEYLDEDDWCVVEEM